MRHFSRLAASVLSLMIVPALAAGALTPPPAQVTYAPLDGCVSGTLDAAATALVADQALADGVGEVAGLPVGFVTDWRIAPGTPSVLLQVGGRWCGVEAFGAAAAEHLPGIDAAGLAAAFAQVAAMPYLGVVDVSDVTVAGDTVLLATVGGRHGALSRWSVTVDALGVQKAAFTTESWTATLDGSVGGFEGVTSLPGHSRTFLRHADGAVRIDATLDDLMARAAAERPAALANANALTDLAPGDDLAHTFEDGYTIHISYGMSPHTPDPGLDTGVARADRLRNLHRGMIENYGDFLRWGVSDPFDATSRTVLGSQSGLPSAHGYINVDSPLSPVCLACAYLADAMEIHVAYFFPEIAPVVANVSYPDPEQFFNGVIGHEMVHSLQGGYSGGAAGSLGNAFVEGSARASEALHDDARNTFQTRSIMFSDSGNGCEGFENGRGGWISAQAAGPFSGHTYDTCYLWLTYYATHGPEGLTSLLEALPAATAGQGNAVQRNLRLLDAAAADGVGTLDLARWGAAFTAGSDADGYTIPAGETGESLDWFSLLKPAERARDLAPSQQVVLGGSGVVAYRVTSAGTISQLPSGAAAYVVDNVNRQLVPTEAGTGSSLAPGQILVLVSPTSTAVNGTLTIS